MPLELGIWRIDGSLERIDSSRMDHEVRLEDILEKDISVASPNWMVIGRQVTTGYGNYIDLLAMDRDGNLVVLELKKDRTPREVVAQLLDYGSWIKDLEDDDIASIYETYLKKYKPDEAGQSLDEAFCNHFKVKGMPDNLNASHELIIVAANLDDSTERIVSYLASEWRVPINAVFFQVFRDKDREYLTRAWFRDPTAAEQSDDDRSLEWNKEFYVSFGEGPSRHWEDAVKYGFVSAGGGSWYSRTLQQLEDGARIWVNVPGTGYVGVGEVQGQKVPVKEFVVRKNDGNTVPITELPVSAPEMFLNKDDPETSEYLVRVNWQKTVPLAQAIKEKGFFGNQNTVAKPTAKSWNHTVERLKTKFGVN